jgi:hypothetical protein
LLAHGRWFSPRTLASSTTKTGRHDISEILLKSGVKHQKSIYNSIVMLSLNKKTCVFLQNMFVLKCTLHRR